MVRMFRILSALSCVYIYTYMYVYVVYDCIKGDAGKLFFVFASGVDCCGAPTSYTMASVDAAVAIGKGQASCSVAFSPAEHQC